MPNRGYESARTPGKLPNVPAGPANGTAAEYGEIVLTRWYNGDQFEVHVDEAPPLALGSWPLLAEVMSTQDCEPDRVCVGIDMTRRPPSRVPVFYRITGWDAEHKALVLVREAAPSVSEVTR